MKQKILFGAGIWIYIFMLSGCLLSDSNHIKENENEIQLNMEGTQSEQKDLGTDLSKGDLYMMFEEKNNETIKSFLYDDYNHDGIHEAFVVTQKDYMYRVWFVSPTQCSRVVDKIQKYDHGATQVLSFQKKKYCLVQQDQEGIKNSLLFTVDNDNNAISSKISGKGYFRFNQNDELLLDTYDSTEHTNDQSGLTYYLYYEYEEGFKEYGAIPISQEQFLKFNGAQKIIEDIRNTYKESDVELSYLYRTNGYINVNITVTDKNKVNYYNMTLKYNSKDVEKVSWKIKDGKVEVAYILEIATFPTAFKEPRNNNVE